MRKSTRQPVYEEEEGAWYHRHLLFVQHEPAGLNNV